MKNEQRYQVFKVTDQHGSNPRIETTFRILDSHSSQQPDLLPEIYRSEDDATAAAKKLNARIPS